MSSARTTGESRKVPLAGRFLVPKDISLIVVGLNLAPALCWSKPAVSDGAYDNSPGTEPESDWLLFTVIAGLALNVQTHGVRYRLRSLDSPVTRIKHGGQEWHRLEGETEESFQARAQAEAVLPPGNSRLLMIME